MDPQFKCSEDCWPRIADELRAAIQPIKQSSARVLLLLLPEYSLITACVIRMLMDEGLAGEMHKTQYHQSGHDSNLMNTLID